MVVFVQSVNVNIAQLNSHCQVSNSTQLIIMTDNCHKGVMHECAKFGLAISAGPFLFCKYFSICVEKS